MPDWKAAVDDAAPSAGLAAIQVPGFQFPRSGACRPEVVAVERRMIAWGQDRGLIPTAECRDRIARTRDGCLAARCCPHADAELR
ncbi:MULTISPECIES: hypothetical protein [Actinomycetes]|uniref:hypothetical protein n=1 Tax=Actinomycetes TaxID=1760 RepID=UPI001319CF5A|nr:MULTISPECIES: hypothetical protein [Actinomycetes]